MWYSVSNDDIDNSNTINGEWWLYSIKTDLKHSNNVINADTDIDGNTDATIDSDNDSNSQCNINSNTDTIADSNTDTNAESNTDTKADSNTDTNSDSISLPIPVLLGLDDRAKNQ